MTRSLALTLAAAALLTTAAANGCAARDSSAKSTRVTGRIVADHASGGHYWLTVDNGDQKIKLQVTREVHQACSVGDQLDECKKRAAPRPTRSPRIPGRPW